VSYDPEPEFERYLERLSRAAHDLPQARRQELLDEIEQHIRDALSQAPCANRDEMLALLEHVGDPAEVAAAAADDPSGGRSRRGSLGAYLRRHTLRVILTVVALAVLGLAIGSVAWIRTYQPLASAGLEMLPAGSKNTLTVNGNASSVGYHKGRPFRLGFMIQNNGRFTVRVLGVPYLSDFPWLRNLPWSARLMMAAETAVPLPPHSGIKAGAHAWHQGRLQPFHPFDLNPGQARFLLLKGVYAHCGVMLAHGTIPLSDFPIQYSFLWKTATAHIPIPGGLTIVPPNNARTGCT
jgi:hypothetical protein